MRLGAGSDGGEIPGGVSAEGINGCCTGQNNERQMKFSDITEVGDNVADVVGRLANIGVMFRVENGQLLYTAPKGVLDQDDIATLKAFRSQIVALLGGYESGASAAEAVVQSESGIRLAPLAFSQLAHWHAYRLRERLSYCAAGMATEWRGRLDLTAFRRAVSAVVQRHDALRTRIVICNETPMQEVRESAEYELIVGDVTELVEPLQSAELARLVSRYMLDPFDIGVFPLFRFCLIRVREDDHVLVTVMEHTITDGVSLSLLKSELFSIYEDIVQDRVSSLVPVPLQFSEYARRQRSTIQPWIAMHYPYWKERMRGCRRVRFPADRRDEGSDGIGVVPFRIGESLRAEVCDWSRRAGTTVVMSFFLAFAALVLRWCNVPESVILFQTDGRTAGMEGTFGYLAAPLYLRVALLDSDSFIDLLRRITQEYSNASDHADASFLEAQLPVPGFSRNARFNWLKAGSADASFQQHGARRTLDVSRFALDQRVVPYFDRDIEPALGFIETGEEILGFVTFRVDRFSVGLMEKFARIYLCFVNALLRSPEAKVKSVVFE